MAQQSVLPDSRVERRTKGPVDMVSDDPPNQMQTIDKKVAYSRDSLKPKKGIAARTQTVVRGKVEKTSNAFPQIS